MPNNPAPFIPSGGAFGYPATNDPRYDQTTHAEIGGGGGGGSGDAILWESSAPPALPTFIAASPPGGTVGVAYSYTFTATGSPTSFAVNSGSIPAGLTFNTSSGVLSGTPTTPASSTFTISATNAAGTTVSPSCNVTVVAASGTGPTSVATYAWYDPSDASTVHATSGTINTLDDKSGNGRTLTSVGAAPPITIGVSTINGLNVITMPSSGSGRLASASLTLAQPITALLVVKLSSASAPGAALEALGEPLLLGYWTTAKWAMYAGTLLLSAGAGDTTAHVLDGIFNGASSSMNLDGANIATGAVGSAGWGSQPISIGANTGGTGVFYNGLIGEVLIYSSALTAPQLAAVEAYLKAKWGTP